jgi:phage terminase large subunit GpA-like protein
LIEENEFLDKHKRNKKLAVEHLDMDNMTILPAWSGSLASVSSVPCKKVILDEIRLMKLTVGDESNTIKLAGDRLTTYLRMGLGQGYGVSTPSIEGDLLHQQLSVPGVTVLYWTYTCSKCGKKEILDFFKNVILIKEENLVVCRCTSCGNRYDESDMKRNMNRQAEYMAKDKDGSLYSVDYEELSGTVIFWYDSLASPFRSLRDIFDEFIKTKDKIHDYKNFWQCWLARFWVEDVSKTNVEELRKTIASGGRAEVPEWCQFLTAGVDSQGTGFYLTVYAWGAGRKTMMIDEFFIDCPVATSVADDVAVLFKREIEDKYYRDAKGKAWQIALWALDTGGNRTKQLYEACEQMQRVVMVKGKNNQNITITHNQTLNLYLIRTIEYLEETEMRAIGVNYELHHNVSEDFLNQFINIRKVNKQNKATGETKVIWKPVGQFDYRMAAVHAFICLDIPTHVGTLRREVENVKFTYNPLVRNIAEKASEETLDSVSGSDESGSYDLDNDYDIGGLEDW